MTMEEILIVKLYEYALRYSWLVENWREQDENVLREALTYIEEKLEERTKKQVSSPEDENPQGHA